MELYYQTYPDSIDLESLSKPPVIIIPGLFGSTSNWRSFAKKLSEKHVVIVVDQRNHGRSPHSETHTYFDMANDLLGFLDRLKLSQVNLCGHSMGGKVAMVFALQHPERIAKLTIMDIAPVQYSHSHAPFLDALLSIDLSGLASRSAAELALRDAIPDTGTRLFLLQSLTGSANNFEWRLNLPVLHKEMSTIVGFPFEELEMLSTPLETCVIYGEESDFVTPAHRPKVEHFFPNVEYSGIANAGHWLHVEQQSLVLAALIAFLQ